MKHTMFSHWNLMHFLRLGLGMASVVQSVMTANWAMVLLVYYLLQCLYSILDAAALQDVRQQ